MRAPFASGRVPIGPGVPGAGRTGAIGQCVRYHERYQAGFPLAKGSRDGLGRWCNSSLAWLLPLTSRVPSALVPS
jgi:hypothetical protein